MNRAVLVHVLSSCALAVPLYGQVFSEGFEATAVGSFPSGWSVVYGGTSQTAVGTPVRSGLRAFRQQAGPSSAAECQFPITLPSGSWSFSGSLRLDSSSTASNSGDVLARVETGSKQCTVAIFRPLSAGGAWRLNFNGADVGAAQTNHWYDFQIIYRADVDRCDLYIDGALIVSNANVVTNSHTPAVIVHTGAINNGILIGQFDDLRIDSMSDIPDLGLIAYFPFDGSPNDMSPSHSTVVANGGPTFVQGRSGGAIQFDGVNDYLLLQHGAWPVDFDTDAFSVSFWAWIDPSQNQFYFMQERNGANLSAITSGGCISCNTLQWGGVWYAPGTGHTGAYAQTTGVQQLTGAWHHYSFVYEWLSPTTGNLKLYVDGVLSATTPRLAAPFSPPPAGLVIGAGQNEAVGNFFKGKMDELRVYSRALTPTEVQGLASAPAILRSPVHVRSWSGQAASFAVYATGSNLTYQWRRNGVPLNEGTQFEGTHSPYLLVNDPSALLAGDYDVVVSSGATSVVSPRATLTAGCSPADVGAQGGTLIPDGQLDNNDFIVFIDQFFAGCN